jgi:hypothetical protein
LKLQPALSAALVQLTTSSLKFMAHYVGTVYCCCQLSSFETTSCQHGHAAAVRVHTEPFAWCHCSVPRTGDHQMVLHCEPTHLPAVNPQVTAPGRYTRAHRCSAGACTCMPPGTRCRGTAETLGHRKRHTATTRSHGWAHTGVLLYPGWVNTALWEPVTFSTRSTTYQKAATHPGTWPGSAPSPAAMPWVCGNKTHQNRPPACTSTRDPGPHTHAQVAAGTFRMPENGASPRNNSACCSEFRGCLCK